jgi:hypothetical protein
MRSLLVALAFVCAIPAVASAQQPVQVYAGQAGPYEVHVWQHRTNNFDRAPYFATNPPVYYGDARVVRSYGWTPYPYLGTSYPVRKAVTPMIEAAEANKMLPPAKPKKEKKAKQTTKSLGA